MFDLANFTLRDMTQLGGTLRRLGDGAGSMEEVANRVVRTLHDELVDAETGERACALVRFFKTHPYAELEKSLRDFARGVLDDADQAAPSMKCLTLLATAGERPEWNRRDASAGHKAIPLASAEIVSHAPMISRLLSQLGVRVEALLGQTPELLVQPEPSSFNVFYVADAKGSDCIPAQDDFVKPCGIESVLGFGGMLPAGDIFVVILFTKIAIPRETAALFRTLALNVKIAALEFDRAVFMRQREGPGAEDDRQGAEIRGLRARVATLEQLLDVYERSVLEQSDKLYTEQQRLRLQTTLLASQGEASPDGILSVSTDGRILFRNRHFADMWGIEPPAMGERCYEDTLRAMAERSVGPTEVFEREAAVAQDEERRDEIPLADGRIFDRYTAPIRSDDGKLLGRVWHFRDVTMVKKIGLMKDDFISAVSHELRTPLTSIRGSLDLIADGVMGEVSNDAMSLVKLARGNCERLARFISDVLDIEKIEAGRVALQAEPIGLEALVERSVASMRPYGHELGVDFVIESSAPGCRVWGDADRLIHVMENLLSNAAKFSPRGGTVRVTVARHGAQLRVSVADRGVGIPPEFHERVFEKFSQIDSPDVAGRSGTGLGLNIARATVEQHGGTIGFSSEANAGSTFHFDLPEWRAEPDEGAAK